MKLNTLIIDDEPIALEKLRSYVAKVPFLELRGACRNGIEASAVIAEGGIDLIFTDINMPDMSGLELLDTLRAAPLVVFITAYTDYAVESYRYSAVDYLLKPYGFAEFQRAANKALERHSLCIQQSPTVPSAHSGEGEGSIFVKADRRYVRVPLADILYIKGCGEYLRIYIAGEGSPLLTLSSFGAIKERLSEVFVQVHRSYIVNMERVRSIGKGRVVMDADTEVPVGESYRQSVMDYLSLHSL
ncbi:MAG: LytTR family DNA-binding domain-containing protein [Candidatus Amulumruptor caecigallinarius]|nr:LytTR family DNA-binding domain-containing protein [Candidatus Amulumruptor caecigallinarius]MCM1396396.1 LytTR family DNA-binding domain-containing protein [Candidatus Amulumruptor caecigallinarius]MCM1453547.1 LytTR family DNA-binding domain-containing protein [bacterium]